jgi:urease accessory protein UreE
MLVITELPKHTRELANRERDTIVMSFEERRWLRRRVTTTAGRSVALALPTGSRITPDAVLAIEENWYLQVEAAAEPVLRVRPLDRDQAISIGFAIGNHHFSLAIDGFDLLVPDDTAMTQLLSRMGVRWEHDKAVFNPVGGGHRHED